MDAWNKGTHGRSGLTERVKAGIHDRVLEVSQFAVPPGSHPLRVRVADSEGREAVHLITLQAK